MRVQYMGTAAAEAVPALFCECPFCREARKRGDPELRLRSGALINSNLMMDFPPDIYHSAIRHGVYLPALTDIVITHPHEDHLSSTELIWRARGYCWPEEGTPKLRVWGSASVGEKMKANAEIADGCEFREIRWYEPFEAAGVTFTALPANHMQGPPEEGPAVPVAPAKPCNYLLEQDGKRLLYAHDTGIPFEEVFDFLKGVRLDAVSLDCCFGPRSNRWSHMGLPENAEVRERLLAMGSADADTKFYCNHFSHNGLIHEGVLYTREVLAEAAAKVGFIPSYDGMVFEI